MNGYAVTPLGVSRFELKPYYKHLKKLFALFINYITINIMFYQPIVRVITNDYDNSFGQLLEIFLNLKPTILQYILINQSHFQSHVTIFAISEPVIDTSHSFYGPLLKFTAYCLIRKTF